MDKNEIKKFINEILTTGKLSNIIFVGKKAYENYKRANSSLWVMSLCFYSVMSVVPVFAIIFSFGTWLGVSESYLKRVLEYSPLNEEAIELLIKFSENFIENARTGVLAGLGFLILGWTLISMLSIVEKSFNDIWQVAKTRIFLRKVTDYISFFIFFPLLILISNGVVTLIIKYFGENSIISLLVSSIPFLTLLLFFTTMYMLIPNTKVKFIPAFISALFTTVIFSVSQKLFIFLQGIINTYNAIYGSFSVIFIFLFWLRLVWFFIILGVHLSYFLQNKSLNMLPTDTNSINFKTKKQAIFLVIDELVKRYKNNSEVATAQDISEEYNIPLDLVLYLLKLLIKKGYVGEIIDGENLKFTIIKNYNTINYKDIYLFLEEDGNDFSLKNLEISKKNMIENFKYDFFIEK